MPKFNTTISDKDTWMFRSTAYFNQVRINGLSGNDGALYINDVNFFSLVSGVIAGQVTVDYLTSIGVVITGDLIKYDQVCTIVQLNSSIWNNTYTTVNQNSAIWNLTASNVDLTEVADASGSWNSVYTTVNTTSSLYLTSVDLSNYALVSSVNNELSNYTPLSTFEQTSGAYTIVQLNSSIWNNTYTTVNQNSATTWNYQGTDIKALTANWESTYNSYYSTSASFLTSVDLTQYTLTSTVNTLTSELKTQIIDLSGIYQPLGLYLSGNSVLNDLTDVSITNPSLDQILKYNGNSWINGLESVINGGAGVDYFYVDGASDIVPYSILSKTPVISSELDETILCNNNKVYLDGYISPLSGIGGTKIDSGVWTFDIWGYVDVADNTSQILLDLYTHNISGTETFLFSVSSGFLNGSLELYSTTTIQPEFIISPTDRLLIKIYGETTANNNRQVHFIHGGNTHYSHFNTPLVIRHNDLAGLQGGDYNQYNHLNNSNYNDLTNNLDNFISTHTTITSLSSNWQNTFNTVSSLSGSWSMVYPSSGIAVSNGSAWIPSITGTSSQFIKADGSLDNKKTIQFFGDLRGMYVCVPAWKLLDMARGSLVFPSGITILNWYVDCSIATPTTQLNANLKYCDAVTTGAFPGANPVLIDILDTTTGNSNRTDMSGSSLGSGIIPSGKIVYFDLDSDPVDLNTTWSIIINYEVN